MALIDKMSVFSLSIVRSRTILVIAVCEDSRLICVDVRSDKGA